MLTASGPAEILRAAQRDENFLSQFHEMISDIVQGVLGIKIWIKFRDTLRVLSDIVYYSLTTLSNIQTLGEEYTGILQTHSSGKSLQKKPIQLLMILINCYGERALIDSLKKFEKYIDNLPADHPLQPHAREKMIQSSMNLRLALPLIQRFHKAIFYMNGKYYEFGKRLTSTRYMLIRHWLKNKSTLPAFRLLGIISFLHLTAHLLYKGVNLKNSQERISKVQMNEPVRNETKCSLCLNNRRNTSAISCGHLFCWDCIISWLQEQPQCPLCRKSNQPSRVVLLQNY